MNIMKNKSKVQFSALKYLLISAIAFCLTSCDDESGAYTDFPVIEAYLYPGNEVSVKVSRQTPFLSDVEYSGDDINNLSLVLIHNDSAYTMFAADSGWYTCNPENVQAGDVFRLSFIFDAREITAYTFIPEKPLNLTQSATRIYTPRMDGSSGIGGSPGVMSDPVQISWDNNDGSYYLMVVENMEASPDPIRDFDDEDRPTGRFRKSPTQSGSEMLRPFDFEYFGLHRIVVYHVLPDYATLYEQNSSSSLNLTNPSTSIGNGYGIFTGLNSDTLYISVIESSK